MDVPCISGMEMKRAKKFKSAEETQSMDEHRGSMRTCKVPPSSSTLIPAHTIGYMYLIRIVYTILHIVDAFPPCHSLI